MAAMLRHRNAVHNMTVGQPGSPVSGFRWQPHSVQKAITPECAAPQSGHRARRRPFCGDDGRNQSMLAYSPAATAWKSAFMRAALDHSRSCQSLADHCVPYSAGP